jgi:hypothetical protein
MKTVIFVVFWCTVNFIQRDASPWIHCGLNRKFDDKYEALKFYNEMKRYQEPDSMALKVPGVYNVRFDSIVKPNN